MHAEEHDITGAAAPPAARRSWLDRWIPPELCEPPSRRVRAEMGLVLPGCYVVLALIEFAAYLWNGALLTALFMLATVPLVGAAPWVLLRTRSLATGAHATAAVFLVLVVAAAAIQGGVDWHALAWVGPSTVFTLFVGGPRVADKWVVANVLAVVALFALDAAGFPFPEPAAGEASRAIDLMELVFLALAMYALASVYHRVNDAVVHELNRVTTDLEHIRGGLDDAQRLARVGSWEANPRTGEVHWSRTLHELTGRPVGVPLTAEAIIGSFHPEERPRFFALWDRLVATGEDGEMDARVILPDGTVRVLHWIYSGVRDAEGALVSLVGTAQDVTEAREAEAALRKAREEAIVASAAKSQFLSHMSHEIRTPLNGVLGMTSLALGTRLDAEQRGYLETAHAAGLHVLTVIGDILDLAKVEAGELVVERIPLSIARVVREVVGTIECGAREKGLALAHEVDPSLPSFLGDPVRVRQILLNLAGNAIKFTEAGGVTLRAGWDPEAPGAVRIVVEDTGPGIPRGAEARIFESFQQVDASTTRRFGGTGLGLAISRKLAAAMGGRLWVESEPGVGSRFHLRLALAVAEGAPAVEDPIVRDDADAPTSPLLVLVADDCAVNARVASKLLGRAGHRVIHVANGREAVRVALEEPVDVVLMDLQMPEIDGLEATRLIRRHEAEAGGHLAIVALTANAVKGDEIACLDAGMDAYLSKPVDPRRLLDTVRSIGGARAVTPAS